MRTKYAFAMWFPIVATTIVVAFLAIAGMPPQQSGPGALTALGLIPNLIMLGLCLIIGLLCVRLRPRPLITSPLIAVATVTIYLLGAFTALASRSVTGYETLNIQLFDSKHQPASSVIVRVSSHQQFSILGALTPRTDAELVTDHMGRAATRVNRRHTIYGTINPQTSGHRSEYRFVGFTRSPNPDGTYRLERHWSSAKEKHANTNMHFHTAMNQAHSDIVAVFLPSAGGDDSNPYDSP